MSPLQAAFFPFIARTCQAECAHPEIFTNERKPDTTVQSNAQAGETLKKYSHLAKYMSSEDTCDK